MNVRTRWLGVVVMALVLGLVACDDSPTEPHGDGEPAEVQLFDRDSGELLAYTHGMGADAHWDGEFPTLAVGEEIEVDVVFLDEDEDEIELGGEYEARLSLADGAAAGVIEWANHGDHADIEGASVGTTSIVVEFWHDDHADWSSPALEITVAGT